jgi:hypothetical protein
MKKLLLHLFIIMSAVTCNAHAHDLSLVSKEVPADLKSNRYSHRKTPAIIPLIAWVGLPQTFTTLKKYQELKDAGITYSYCPFSDSNAMEAALNMAQKVGIKLFVACPELTAKPEETVKRFMNHPAIAGYFLSDELGTSAFQGVSSLIKRIEVLDRRHICYVNLLPNYAGEKMWGAKTYNDYVNIYLKNVPIKVLSFDHYPVIGNTSQSIRSEWYQNLEIISDGAKRFNKPFWAFALSVAFGPYPLPTIASLRLQVYSNLAYGAQGIQYFTYYTLMDPNNNFNNAPLDPQGKLTASYNKVKQINEEIKGVSGVFLKAHMISVGHTGSIIPIGTHLLNRLPKPIKSLKTQGMGAVVSVLKKNEFTYMVIVNRDIVYPMTFKVACSTGVRRVLKNGTLATTKMNTNFKLAPGDISIFRWSNTMN